MEWLMLVPPVLLLGATLLAPGWLVAAASGVRGLSQLTLAPAVSVGVVTLAGLVCGLAGVPWGLPAVVVTAALVAAAAFALRRWRRWGALPDEPGFPGTPWRHAATACTALTVAGGALLWLRHLTNIMPSPTAYSQTWDNVFHLNAIRYISTTGHPGPMLPTNLDASSGTTFFYPTGWHELAALAMPVAGDSVQLASTALLFVTCALVWPLSALELTLGLGVRSPAALLSTGVLAASFAAFPFLMLDWGVLYPNLLSYAAIPAALALLNRLLHDGPLAWGRALPLGWLTLLVGVGITLSHPNGLFLTFALALAPLAAGCATTIAGLRSGTTSRPIAAAWLAAAALAVVVFVLAWWRLRPSNRWMPLMDVRTAIEQAALANPILGPPGVVPPLLTLAGLVLLALRPGRRWYLGASAGALLLWVAVAGLPEGGVREFLTGIWYSDSYRLAPALVLLSVPAAAVAVDAVAAALLPQPTGGYRPRRGSEPRVTGTTLLVALVLPAVVLASTQWSLSIHHAVTHAATAYDLAVEPCAEGDVTCLTTADEQNLLDRVAELTPPDAVILADPAVGASLAYAFAGRHVTRPYIGGRPTPAEQFLLDHLSEDPAPAGLCDALAATGVTHVLDFGSQIVHSRLEPHPGLENLASSPSVRLVANSGDVALYEVIACR